MDALPSNHLGIYYELVDRIPHWRRSEISKLVLVEIVCFSHTRPDIRERAADHTLQLISNPSPKSSIVLVDSVILANQKNTVGVFRSLIKI